MKKITIDQLKKKLTKLTKEDTFSLTFKKANGETRHYDHCHVGVHIVNEDATRHGLTAKENLERGNLLFFCDDIGEAGSYRIAKFDNIADFETIGEKNEKFEIAR